MVIGAYRISGRLGTGGQASVYRAQAPDGRDVVVKVWNVLGPDPDRERARISREAALVGRIRHSGVVALLDARPHDDPPHIVFEYIDGSTLEERVARHGPLSGEVAVWPARFGLAMPSGRAQRVADPFLLTKERHARLLPSLSGALRVPQLREVACARTAQIDCRARPLITA